MQRRSLANFRGRYVIKKTRFSGFQMTYAYIEYRPYVTLNASLSVLANPSKLQYYLENQMLEISFFFMQHHFLFK